MALSIQTNVSALNAQRNLQQTMQLLDSSLTKLSSGFRITKAGDDAAGLGISENLKAQIRSSLQAQRNAYDGISVIQTAEGGLNELSNILIRMRELAMQSASDGVGDTQRGYIEQEFDNLVAEVDRIAGTTEFNGTYLLNGNVGSTNGLVFQVGIRATTNDTLSVSVDTATTTALGLTAGVTCSTQTEAQSALGVIDAAIEAVSTRRAALGALGNRLNSTIANLGVAAENLSAANSRIRDVDVATEASNQTRAQVLLQAGIGVLAQANAVPQVALNLLR